MDPAPTPAGSWREADVAIMGGGPAGASLAARLAGIHGMRVAVFEKERFPREHIGESLASPAVPCLQETGALGKVLASECYVQKFGGYYAWDGSDPSVAFFRHRLWEQDGCHRWSLHVNRPEFDEILLEHARSLGAAVKEGVAVTGISHEGDAVVVATSDGGRLEARLFVDASGRTNRITTGRRKLWLSKYRNIGIWTHFLGGKPAQSAPGDWNLFRDGDLSPIGCFAFRDGWCWYIPVPRILNGKRVLTHSVGIVTDPKILRTPGTRFTSLDDFVPAVRSVPLLGDLLGDAEPLYQPSTATNYSMISGDMCDYDQRWLLVGDAAYFVDPLFSSGVSFALLQAAAAEQIITATFDDAVPTSLKRELWADYTETWTTTAQAFALAIDQWYAAIAAGRPDSVYWNERATAEGATRRLESFHTLIDGEFQGDLLFVMSKGGRRLRELAGHGPFADAIKFAADNEPMATSRLCLRESVDLRDSLTLEGSGTNGSAAATGTPRNPFLHPPFWTDPLTAEVQPFFGPPLPCLRFCDETGTSRTSVKAGSDRRAAGALYERLRAGQSTFDEMRKQLSEEQWSVMLHLLSAGLIEAGP